MSTGKAFSRVHSAVSPLEATSSMEQEYGDDSFHMSPAPLAVNFRDVSELDSSKLCTGIAYRCSEVFSCELLSQYNINTLIDMRKQPAEETHPVYLQMQASDKSLDETNQPIVQRFEMIRTSVKLGILAQMPWRVRGKLVKCVLTGGNPDRFMCSAVCDPEIFGFTKLYKLLVDKAGDAIAGMLRLFADKENFPILFHCTHGKDRTGILCCLLGLIAGVSHNVICEDYVQSGRNLHEAKVRHQLPIPEHLLEDTIIDAPYEAISNLISHIESKYGGVVGYLTAIGLTESEIKAIRNNIQAP